MNELSKTKSLGILGSIPAAWLILTLLVLLIYLLTRCCDRKPRPSRSISALKITLAIVSVLCCAAVGLGLYGNDDLHNGLIQTLNQGKQVDIQVAKIRNQTDAIERQLLIQAKGQLKNIKNIFEAPTTNVTVFKMADSYLTKLIDNNTMAANAAKDIREALKGLDLTSKIVQGGEVRGDPVAAHHGHPERSAYPLLGVARHNRCALIAFSVCGLLAVIASYLMASVYLASSVALADLCMAPDKFIEDQASTDLSKEILKYYTNCERARANPFTQRLREAKTSIEHMRFNLNLLTKPALYLFPKKGLDTKFSSLTNDINAADRFIHSLTALVDCRSLHMNYLRGARALCNVGLWGLTLMLQSALLAGLLLTALVWVDSHTWIYIRKKKDYHQVNEADPYLPPPQASQAIAARTLQRSQGSSYPPDTPPPSYTSALLHNRSTHASAPPRMKLICY
ncbi:hypothetical protein NQ318_014081 [Aromia moschata]|uniref:Protein tweety homolog n=1 Tax=Aromia moschata TaxID=1265417 RepID=A0AAV8Z0L2_9CUCU|nr:hypothetical protein NQ318_014081 [Aromia moschata]